MNDRVGHLKPEAKVNMAIEMTEAMVGVCLDGIRRRNPDMTKEEVMNELRERFDWAKRWQLRKSKPLNNSFVYLFS